MARGKTSAAGLHRGVSGIGGFNISARKARATTTVSLEYVNAGAFRSSASAHSPALAPVTEISTPAPASQVAVAVPHQTLPAIQQSDSQVQELVQAPPRRVASHRSLAALTLPVQTETNSVPFPRSSPTSLSPQAEHAEKMRLQMQMQLQLHGAPGQGDSDRGVLCEDEVDEDDKGGDEDEESVYLSARSVSPITPNVATEPSAIAQSISTESFTSSSSSGTSSYTTSSEMPRARVESDTSLEEIQADMDAEESEREMDKVLSAFPVPPHFVPTAHRRAESSFSFFANNEHADDGKNHTGPTLVPVRSILHSTTATTLVPDRSITQSPLPMRPTRIPGPIGVPLARARAGQVAGASRARKVSMTMRTPALGGLAKMGKSSGKMPVRRVLRRSIVDDREEEAAGPGEGDEDEVVLRVLRERVIEKNIEGEREMEQTVATPITTAPAATATSTASTASTSSIATPASTSTTGIAQSVALAERAEGVDDDAYEGVENYAVPPPPYTYTPVPVALSAYAHALLPPDTLSPPALAAPVLAGPEGAGVGAFAGVGFASMVDNVTDCEAASEGTVVEAVPLLEHAHEPMPITVLAPTPRRAHSGIPVFSERKEKQQQQKPWEGEEEGDTPVPQNGDARSAGGSDDGVYASNNEEKNAHHINRTEEYLAAGFNDDLAQRLGNIQYVYKYDRSGMRYAILPRRLRLPSSQLRILSDLFRTVVSGLERRFRLEQAQEQAQLDAEACALAAALANPEPATWYSPHSSRAPSPRATDIRFARFPLVEDPEGETGPVVVPAPTPQNYGAAEDDDEVLLSPFPPAPPVPTPASSPPPGDAAWRLAAERDRALPLQRFLADQARLHDEQEAERVRTRAREMLDVQDAILAIRLKRRLLAQGVTEAELEVVLDEDEDGEKGRGDLELPEGVALEDEDEDEDADAMAACEAEMERERMRRACAAPAPAPLLAPGKAAATTALSMPAIDDDDDEILIAPARPAVIRAPAPTVKATVNMSTQHTRTRAASGPTRPGRSVPISTPPPSPPPSSAHPSCYMVAFLTFNHRYGHPGRRHGTSTAMYGQGRKRRSPLATCAWMGDKNGVIVEDVEPETEEAVWDCESVVDWYAGGME